MLEVAFLMTIKVFKTLKPRNSPSDLNHSSQTSGIPQFKKEIRESYIERKIQDVWKYDLDKNGVINVNEYRKLLEDEWDDNPKNE